MAHVIKKCPRLLYYFLEFLFTFIVDVIPAAKLERDHANWKLKGWIKVVARRGPQKSMRLSSLLVQKCNSFESSSFSECLSGRIRIYEVTSEGSPCVVNVNMKIARQRLTGLSCIRYDFFLVSVTLVSEWGQRILIISDWQWFLWWADKTISKPLF